jgi:hypothetical protein
LTVDAMALPILVPEHHEMALLGSRAWPAPTPRRFRWRPSGSLRPGPPPGVSRRGRFAAPDSPTIREALLAHWRRRCHAGVHPCLCESIEWSPRTSSDFRTLLQDAEAVVKTLLRRRRRTQDVHPRALATLARTFDIGRWRLRIEPRQREAFALLLCTMYWRGCRVPAAINSPPLHPSTGLVRWLSQFTVRQQADHGHQILRALAAQEARVHEFALQIAHRMLPTRAASPRWVVVLPELLKGVEML